MDIVNLSKKKRNRRLRDPERRHTTEVRFNPPEVENQSVSSHDNKLSLSNDNISNDPAVADSTHFNNQLSVPKLSIDPVDPLSLSSASSWNSLFDIGDFESPPDTDYNYFGGSQVGEFEDQSTNAQGSYDVAKHQYQLSYELAIDNVLTPFANHGPPVESPLVLSRRRPRLSHVEHVIHELKSTEQIYIQDLSEVVDGYRVPLVSHVGVLPLRESDLKELFGNISEILEFHRGLMSSLEVAEGNPNKIAMCFLSNAENFKIYTHYCNNYPKSVNTLTALSKNAEVSQLLKRCQQRLNHMLPLGAYLLKPVQRVLKYSLLLTDMLKHLDCGGSSFDVVDEAIQKMTAVAEHINAMKRKYDAAVHVQEMQSLIRGNEGLDLTKYGDLIHEDMFRYFGGKSASSTFRGKTERYVFLFERLCLITKKEEVGYQYKAHLEMKDLQLTEKIDKDPNSFHIRQVSTGRSFTFQARSLSQKNLWVHTIKLQLMESLPHLPDKAREMILKGFPTYSDLGNSWPRHRHHSEEPLLLSMLSSKVETLNQHKSKTIGHGISGSVVSSGKKIRSRSTTSPQTSTAMMLAQASLTGFLSASIIENNSEKTHPTVLDESHRAVESFLDSRERGYSETNEQRADLPSPHEVFSPKHVDSKKCSPKSPQVPQVKTRSSSSPQLSRKFVDNSLQNMKKNENEAFASRTNRLSVESSDCINEEDKDISSPDFEIVSTNFSSELPEVEVEIEAGNNVNETNEYHEALFDELMSSGADRAVVSGSPHAFESPHFVDNTPTEADQAFSFPTLPASPKPVIDLNVYTPKEITPVSIRRWSVKKRRSYDSNDSDNLPTPKASPIVQRSATLKPSKFFLQKELESTVGYMQEQSMSSLMRRHSFQNNDPKKLLLLHQKEGSLSTDNTPLSSPRAMTKKRSWRRRNSSSPANHSPSTTKQSTVPEISVIGLVGTSRDNVNLEDISLVVPDPEDNEDRKSIILTPPREFQQNTSLSELASRTDVSYTADGTSNSAQVDIPVEPEAPHSISEHLGDKISSPNPDELVSFDEFLEDLDTYSNATGRSSHRLPSPEPIKKKKKKKLRSFTVAVDSDTMRKVREEMTRSKQDESRVQKLAREYSQKIKLNEKSHSFKRFSHIIESSRLNAEDSERREPMWLQKLRERRKSRDAFSMDSTLSDDDSLRTNDSDNEMAKKGGFRGWVRSLVDKFSITK